LTLSIFLNLKCLTVCVGGGLEVAMGLVAVHAVSASKAEVVRS
jgi:hypothetical protein